MSHSRTYLPCNLLIITGVYLIVMVTPSLSATVEQKVHDAINAARRGDYELLSNLMREPNRAEQMKYLKRFVHDPNDDIRSDVAVLATGVGTRESLEILSALVADTDAHNVGWRAELALFGDFDCRELASWGGERLKRNLLLRLQRYGMEGRGILIMGCFGDDPDVVSALKRSREAANGIVRLYYYGTTVTAEECFDLALAIAGDAESVERVVKRIRWSRSRQTWFSIDDAPIQGMVFILRAIKFVDNERILNELLDLLDDTRPALPYGPAHGGDSRMIRLCDLTLTVLAKKLNIDPRFPIESDVPLPYTPIPRFTEWQRERAHRLFKTHFRKQNFLPARNT